MMMLMSEVDDRVRSAASQWGLTMGEELAGGTRSAVFAATDELGRDLVLKLPALNRAHGDPTEAEAAALRSWAGTSAAVDLVAVTADALLLARARPGRQQPWRPEGHLDDTVGMAGELLRRLWSAPPGYFRYPTLSSVYAEDERVARDDASVEQRKRSEPDRGVPGLRRLPAAAVAAEQLMVTAPASILLHGDFITKNIVSDDTSPLGYVALDPLPRWRPSPPTIRPRSLCRSLRRWLRRSTSPRNGRSGGRRSGPCTKPHKLGVMTKKYSRASWHHRWSTTSCGSSRCSAGARTVNRQSISNTGH